jgi:primosomal protein N''
MINEEKGKLYDKYLAEVDIIQRQISKLKSQYVVNIPENIQNEIYQKQLKINEYERLVKNLF